MRKNKNRDQVGRSFYRCIPHVKRQPAVLWSSEEKITIIPYGVDVEKFSYYEKTKVSSPLSLVYVGQISRRKGLHHLLKYARDNVGKVTLKLAGDFNKKYDLYEEYAQDSNIEFLGFVTRDRLSQVYRESDVFIFPLWAKALDLLF